MSSSQSFVTLKRVASPRPPELAEADFEERRAGSRTWTLIVCTALVTWFAVVFAIARSLFADFHLQRYDLGNMVQAVWSTAHGRLLETTLGTGVQSSRLASHVDPLLVLLTPLWVAFPSPLTLVAAQVAACALGAIPVFWLARKHVSETAAGLIALAYLANPWLIWVALDSIHPATLAIPLLLFAIWFLDADRLVPFALVAIVAASAGELVGLAIAAIGVWYWIARDHRRAGLAITALGVTWTWFCLEVVIPHYADSKSQYYGLYSSVGGSPLGVLKTALTEPGSIISELVTSGDVAYLLALTAPFAGLFLLSPLLLAAAAPQLAANMLSSIGGHTDPRLHTVSVVLPFLTVATIFGIARLRPARATIAATIVLATSVGMTVVFGPRSGDAVSIGLWYYGDPSPEHLEAVREAVALVPAEAPVATTTKAGSQLSARRFFYSIPIFKGAEWVVIDTQDPWVPVRPAETERTMWGSFNPRMVKRTVAVLDESSDWRRVYRKSGVFVFRKVRPDRGPQTATAPRRKSTISPVVAPGPNTSATPAALSSSASS